MKKIETAPITIKSVPEMSEEELNESLECTKKYLKQLEKKQKEFEEIRKQKKIKEVKEQLKYINDNEYLKKFILDLMPHDRYSCSDENPGNGIYYKIDDTLSYTCAKCAFLDLLNNYYEPPFAFNFKVEFTPIDRCE